MLSLVAFGTNNNGVLTALHKKRNKKEEPSSEKTKKEYPIYNSLARSPINNRMSLLLTILTHTIIIFGPNNFLPLKIRLYSNGLISHWLVDVHWLANSWLIRKLWLYYRLICRLVCWLIYGIYWLRLNWLLIHYRLARLIVGLVYGMEGRLKGLL